MLCRDVFTTICETYGAVCLAHGAKDEEAFGILLDRTEEGMLCLSADGILSCGGWRAQIPADAVARAGNDLSNSFATLYRRTAMVEQLRARVARNEPLQTVLDYASSLLGNPLILIDRSYRVIAVSNCAQLNDPLWEANIARGYCTYDFIVGFHALTLDIPASTPDAFDAPCDLSPRQKLCSQLFWNGTKLATVFTMDSYRPIELWHRSILPVISSELVKLLSQSELSSALLGSAAELVLENLLVDRDADAAGQRLFANSVTLPASMCCCCVKPIATLGSASKEILKTQLRAIVPDGYVVTHGEWTALFCKARYPDVLTAQQTEQLRRLFDKYVSLIGVSSVFTSYADVPEAFACAQRAAQLSVWLGRERDVVFYDAIKHLDLLMRWGDAQSLAAYRHPALHLLKEHDRANDGDLLEILSAYIRYGCNAKQTAAALFIHRNTLNHRLSKISDLANLDFSDPDTVYRLAFSLWIEQIYSPAHQSQRV